MGADAVGVVNRCFAAIATVGEGGQASSSDSSSSAAISEKHRHRESITMMRSEHGKTTYLWAHAICASSQVTGLGWAYVWLSGQELPIG